MKFRPMGALPFLLLAVVPSGCLSLGPSESARVVLHHLSLTPEPWDGPTLPYAVAIRPFSSRVALESEGVRYLGNDVNGGYWADHRWAEPVAAMVQEAVERDLDASGLFSQVLLAENAGLAEFLLSAKVHRFEEEDRDDGWYGVVEITVEVLRARDGASVCHRRLFVEERAEKETVREVVRALSRAVSRVLTEVRQALLVGCRGG